jgi:hypothetical protein
VFILAVRRSSTIARALRSAPSRLSWAWIALILPRAESQSIKSDPAGPAGQAVIELQVEPCEPS